MATQANQPNDVSSNKETVGISYAGAVLNLKNSMDSNKENIQSAVQAKEIIDKPGKVQQQCAGSGHGGSRPAPALGKPSKKDDFPQINSRHSRNRHNDRDRDKKQGNQQSCDPEGTDSDGCEKHNNKLNTKAKQSDSDSGNGNEPQALSNEDKIKFVEAPLPKVNPWTVKRNASISIPSNNPLSASIPASEKNSDKRILQPQQQSTSGKSAHHIKNLFPVFSFSSYRTISLE